MLRARRVSFFARKVLAAPTSYEEATPWLPEKPPANRNALSPAGNQGARHASGIRKRTRHVARKPQKTAA
jgi:hypothetical protein